MTDGRKGYLNTLIIKSNIERNELLASLFVELSSTVQVEIEIVTQKDRVSVFLGDELTTTSTSEIRRQLKEGETATAVHTHNKPLPPSMADYRRANGVTDINFLVASSDGRIYQYKVKGNLENFSDRVSNQSLIRSLKDKTVSHDILCKRLDLYIKNVSDYLAGESRTIDLLLEALVSLNSGSFDSLTTNQQNTIIEVSAGSLVNNFREKFEQLGLEFRAGKKLKDLPLLETMINGCLTEHIPKQKIIDTITEDASNLQSIHKTRQEKFDTAKNLRPTLTSDDELSDETVNDLLTLRSEVLEHFIPELEDKGVIHNIALELSLVESDEDFNNRTVATRIISKDEMIKLL